MSTPLPQPLPQPPPANGAFIPTSGILELAMSTHDAVIRIEETVKQLTHADSRLDKRLSVLERSFWYHLGMSACTGGGTSYLVTLLTHR